VLIREASKDKDGPFQQEPFQIFMAADEFLANNATLLASPCLFD
jgi:hypothetical protein